MNFFKRTLIFSVLMISSLLIFSCESDDSINDSSNPDVSELLTEISTAPDMEFKFEGKITDDAGISSIRIYYADWFLDKTIQLKESPKEYDLNYKFSTPENVTVGSSHTVQVEITDLGGNLVTREVVVTLDLDVTNPELTFNSPQDGLNYISGEPLPVSIEVSDNNELQSLHVMSEDLNLDEVIQFSNEEINFNYTNEIQIPNELLGSVELTATVTDAGGNETSKTINFTISSDISYAQVFVVGGPTWYDWDPSKATRMWQNPSNDEEFIVEFYYNSGTDFKFLGQLDWSPYNWGLNPNDNTRITNSQDSEGIELPDGDGYYRVTFNPYQLDYSYEKMTVDIDQKDEMYLVGKGFVGYDLDWSPADAIPMTKDSNNPYVFTIDIEFSDEVDLKYLGQNDGWGPYDAGFEVGGEQQLPVNYVKGVTGDGSPDLKFRQQAGTYRVNYDYFLLRTTIQPVE